MNNKNDKKLALKFLIPIVVQMNKNTNHKRLHLRREVVQGYEKVYKIYNY